MPSKEYTIIIWSQKYKKRRNLFFPLDKPYISLYICILKTLKAMNQEIQQYQSDDARITLDVRVENDIVWLTQAQIGILFGVQKSAISKHLKNIFNSGELCQESVVSILETTANDGKTYDVRYYNLDAVYL